MKAKNRKDRINSFLKFLLLFTLTTTIIVIAFFFDFNRIPLKENSVLRSEVNTIKKEMEFQKEFSEDMKSIKAMIDSLEIPGQNGSLLNSLISTQTAKLQEKIPIKDSTYRYDMYKNIIWSFSEVQKLKQQLSVYSDSEKIILEYKEALGKCRDDLEDSQRTVDALRNN